MIWILEQLRLDRKKGATNIMKSLTYQITDEQGMHARPAGELVNEAKKYDCEIRVGKCDENMCQSQVEQLEQKGRLVDCRKIFAVMSLGVKQGDTVCFTFEGREEDKAAKALEEFMKKNM